jgi:iron complex outermembrane receptor protein
LKKQLMLKQSVVAVALTLAASQYAFAQQAAEPQRVTVTGSNIKRTSIEGTSAIQTITAREIAESGAASIPDLMRLVPSMGSNFNIDAVGSNSFAAGVATASLRGLSSASTLILLNGRRMTPAAYADPNAGNSALYDLNSIPLSALQSVEILKEGASAIYGSDAIGGVINFITKSDYQGAEISASASSNEQGQFGRNKVTGTIGFGDYERDGYNVMVTAELGDRDRVALMDNKEGIAYEQMQIMNGRYRDTRFGSQVSQYPIAFRETAPGSKNFGVSLATAPTNMVFNNTGCPADRLLTGSTALGLASTSTLIGRTFCNFNSLQFAEQQSAGKDGSVMSRATFKLSPTTQAFAEAAYTRSQRTYTDVPITLGTGASTIFTATGLAPSFQIILPIGHPDNPFTNARASVNYRFENKRGGRDNINENTRLVGGFKGSNFNWDWETAVLFNRNDRTDTTFDRLYVPTLSKINTGTTLAQLAADPTITRDVVSDAYAQITQLDGKATREFGQFAGGKGAVAVGFEARKEEIKITPDPVLARGDIAGLSNSLIDGKRNVASIFGEARLPLIKTVDIELAARYDKYQRLEGHWSPKVAAKWTPVPSLAFRGTYSEGFRAPALVQVTPGGSQFFLNGFVDPKRCELDGTTPKPGAFTSDCAKTAAGVSGYNPDLKPETAKSYSLGMIWSPTNNFDVLIDAFKIRKVNEVILGTLNDALKGEDKNPGLISRDNAAVNLLKDAAGNPIPNSGPILMVMEPWINQGATEVRGIDFEFRLRNRLGAWGSLSTKLSSTYTAWYSIAQHEGDKENNVAGGRSNYWDWGLSRGVDNPRWKTTLSTSWSYGVHAVGANLRYTSPISLLRVVDYTDPRNEYTQPFCEYGRKQATDYAPDRSTAIPLYEDYYPKCAVPAWTTVGLSYTYTGFKNLSLSANVQNLFDKAAPYDPDYAGTATAPGIGYNTKQHNPYGRYWTLTARYTFK